MDTSRNGVSATLLQGTAGPDPTTVYVDMRALRHDRYSVRPTRLLGPLGKDLADGYRARMEREEQVGVQERIEEMQGLVWLRTLLGKCGSTSCFPGSTFQPFPHKEESDGVPD